MSRDDSGLTERQKLFAEKFAITRNGTRAWMAVSGTTNEKAASVQAARLLGNARVKAHIDELIGAETNKAKEQREWVINRLMQIAGVDMSDLASWNESGMTWKDSAQLSDAAKASVQQIEQVMNEHGGTLKIKQYDRMGALKLLGQHFGMFKEQLEVNATVTARPAEHVDDDELEKALE